MKRLFIFITMILFFTSCKEKVQCSLTADTITIQFLDPFEFSDNDFLIIDSTKYMHTYYPDSIINYNFLPKEKLHVFSDEKDKGKFQNVNELGIAQTLARKLIKSKNYELLNNTEILINGNLTFKRKDNQKIKIITSLNYLAKINKSRCH